MSKKYGTLIVEINNILEIYKTEENGTYAVYLKKDTNSGRMKRALLKTGFLTQKHAEQYCKNIIEMVHNR